MAIAREVPAYARALEGEFGQAVRVGVEVALNRFLDLLADARSRRGARRPHLRRARARRVPGGPQPRRAARRLPRRRPRWRGGGSSRPASPAAWSPTRSTRSAARSSPTSTSSPPSRPRATRRSRPPRPASTSAAAGGSCGCSPRTRPPGRRPIRTAATAARWRLPRGGVAALVAATAGEGEPGEAQLDSIAARLARRLGEGAIGAEADGAALVFVPDPDAPARRRRIERAIEDEPTVLGPTVDWPRAAASARRAGDAHRLAVAGRLGRHRRARRRRRPSRAAPARRRSRRRRRPRRAPGSRRSASSPTARARGSPRRSPRGSTAPARSRPSRPRSDVHPADRPLPRAPAARAVRGAARGSRREVRARPRVTSGMTARCYSYARCACS